jgi:hypothetical protein
LKANLINATSLRQVLDQYCASSGQLVSEAKCSIFFSPNVEVDVKAQICEELNIMTEAISEKYLGLPAMVGLDRTDSFIYLLERIIERLKGWKERFLSMGGKEILLKAIIQAIPVFAMGIFKIPKKLCKDINDAMAGFWWGDTEEQRRMHWFTWWKMCIPKNMGGMGFRDLHSFNLAMLAKQSWRLLSRPDSLCARVLKAKYYPNNCLLNAGPKSGSSFTWQSIVAGLQTFKRGHIWRIGSGKNVNIWEDHWIPSSPTRKVYTRRGHSLVRTVDDLIDPGTNSWDEDLIRSIFVQIDAERILRIPLSHHLSDDFVAWNYTSNFCFSVRSAYHIQWEYQFGHMTRRRDGQGSAQINPVWEIMWSLNIPSKVKIFLWKALHGVLPGLAILARRHIISPQCPICKSGPEDICHILFKCLRAKEIWNELGLTDEIQHALIADRSGSVVLEHILRSSNREVPNLDKVTIHELIAVGG